MNISKMIWLQGIFLVLTLILVLDIHATEWYVNPAGDCRNDGLTPGTPKKTITCALTGAYPGDTIHIAAGTYNLALGETFPIELKPYKHTDGVSLVGDNKFTTIINASGAGKTAIEMSNNTAGMSIQNLTVTGVNTVGSVGIGISMTGSANVTISNCIIKNNTTDSSGAGINCWTTNAVIMNNLLEGNTVLSSVNDGGAMQITNCSPLVMYNTFRNNSAGAGGGALHIVSLASGYTNPEISNNTFENNTADFGGGISIFMAQSAYIHDNLITGNTGREAGGGVWVYGGSAPIIESNIIVGNKCENPVDGGGGFRASETTRPTFKNNLIINNYAAGNGGAGFCLQANTTITNCTCYGNTAGGPNAGIWFYQGTGSVNYSILWEEAGNDLTIQAATVSVKYSDFHDTPPTGTGNFSINPVFVTGPFTPVPLGNFYLAKDSGEGGPSPCVDAGDVTAASLGLSDMRTTRTDGNFDTGMIDLGYHYESHLPTPTPTTTPTPVPAAGSSTKIVVLVFIGLVLMCVLAKISL